jgi:hypothetical protein
VTSSAQQRFRAAQFFLARWSRRFDFSNKSIHKALHVGGLHADAIARLNAALEGRYTIERELGEGGLATVYLAKDLKHNRNVALKVLKPELAAVVGAALGRGVEGAGAQGGGPDRTWRTTL